MADKAMADLVGKRSTYSVQVYNSMIMATRYVGKFATIGEADEYVRQDAYRSRSFVRYVVMTPTMVPVVGSEVRGFHP